MTERNAWIIERIDLGLVMQRDNCILSPTRGQLYDSYVVRYEFVPTQFPENHPFTVRFEHDPTTKPEQMELDECLAIGKAIRGMLTSDRTESRRDKFRWDVDPTPIRDAVRDLHLSDADRAELTSDRTASTPSSGQTSEPPPTA